MKTEKNSGESVFCILNWNGKSENLWKMRKRNCLFFAFAFIARAASSSILLVLIPFVSSPAADIYAFLVVFVLPLNSAVNPILYTFTTPKYRNQVLLRGWNKLTSRKTLKHEGSGHTGSGHTGSNSNQSKHAPITLQLDYLCSFQPSLQPREERISREADDCTSMNERSARKEFTQSDKTGSHF